MIPNNISKEHIEKAIEEIDKKGIRKERHSSTYDLVYNGKNYPPKLAISIANRFANGSELDASDFSGGKGTDAFKLLEYFGFQIVEKNNSKVIADFERFLSKFHKNKSTTLEYLKMIPKIEKWFIGSNICNSNFNIWKDVSEIDAINKSLKSKNSVIWKELNKKEKNWYSAPWNKWVEFNSMIKSNFWIFQGNPKTFDFETALKQGILTDWTVNAHKDNIKVGDKVILWITGSKSGCYALAEVTSEPHQKTSSTDDHLWKGDDKSDLKADIKITHNLVDTPILKTDIDSLDELKNLKVGNQGTNFSATKKEYQTILEMSQLIGFEQEENLKKLNVSDMKLSLNTILYGPPGTGKTYKLQNEYFDLFTVSETSLTKSQYLENIVSDLTWWQVLSIILLDLKKTKVNNITEHELLKIRAKLSNSKSVRPTIWGRLQAHTSLECPNVGVTDRSEPKIFYKDENSFWTVNEELLEQYYPEAISILDEIQNFKPSPDKFIKNYEFVTFHQSFSYEDFVEGIKPKMEDQEIDVSYEIQDGIFKKLCLKAAADPENQYALFIDEINRGNVSAIFGELITLIEDDKRIGEENALTVKLPYSKKDLGVPSNLHIIGTMNTADRSVEALDTALRRRFAFEEIMPLPHLLQNISFDGFDLQEVLETINKRIEALLDRDHCIGHSYFIKIQSKDTIALKQTFENKIIPLLQEYFYQDYEKIALILGQGFIERKEIKVEFASFSKLDEPEMIPSYELIKQNEDIEDSVRKLLNRKDEEAQ